MSKAFVTHALLGGPQTAREMQSSWGKDGFASEEALVRSGGQVAEPEPQERRGHALESDSGR